jgi:hypothetical protein
MVKHLIHMDEIRGKDEKRVGEMDSRGGAKARRNIPKGRT